MLTYRYMTKFCLWLRKFDFTTIHIHLELHI